MQNTFLTLDGKVFKTDRFMQGPKLTEGCHWRNAYEKTWVETRGESKTFRVAEYDGAEFIKPWGSYSMAPIIRAGA